MKPLPSISVSIEHSRRITFFRFRVSVLAALLACSFAPAVRAEERIKIVVGFSSISVSQAVPWVMREAKLFEKYGLNPELVYMASSKVAPAMVSGDLHIAQVGGDMLVRSTLNGFAMVYIGGTNNNFNFSLTVHPDIKKIEDLKGTTFGVTRIGSSTDFCARLLLKKFGLRPDEDVKIFQTGGNPESLAALQAGVIKATLLSTPVDLKAHALGFPELIDVRKMKIPYPSTGIGTTRSFVQNNRDTALRYMMAYIEGVNLFFTNKKIGQQVIKKYTHTTDAKILDITYEYGLKTVERIPYPTLEGLQTVLDVVSAADPRARSYKPADFVDLSLLQELEKRGFIKKFSAP